MSLADADYSSNVGKGPPIPTPGKDAISASPSGKLSISNRCLCRGLLPNPQSPGGLVRQRVGPNLVAVTVMASEPDPTNAKSRIQLKRFRPQLTMLQANSTPFPPPCRCQRKPRRPIAEYVPDKVFVDDLLKWPDALFTCIAEVMKPLLQLPAPMLFSVLSHRL
jgi:hypothetical protein